MAARDNSLAIDVLGITELLESVLGELDFKDLLRARRVSRHWLALIDTSPGLQRRLFLSPRGQIATNLQVLKHNDQPWSVVEDDHQENATLHPVLCDQKLVVTKANMLVNRAIYSLSQSWQYEEASWRRMQIRQPPTRTLTLKCSYKNVFQCVVERYTFVNENGITGQDLIDALATMTQIRAALKFVHVCGLREPCPVVAITKPDTVSGNATA